MNANNRLVWEGLTVENTLAYYVTTKITSVNFFIVLAPLHKKCLKNIFCVSKFTLLFSKLECFSVANNLVPFLTNGKN